MNNFNPLEDSAADPFIIADNAAQQIRQITGVETYATAVTLGSGWGKSADKMGTVTHVINAETITGFNPSRVAGHNSTLKSVKLLNGKHVLVIGARTHFYESNQPYHVRQVVHSVRTAASLGVGKLILTNGAGSIRCEWNPGTVVMIRDHINLTAASPLEGAKFVDLTDLYSKQLRAKVAETIGTLPEGVYVQFRGPHYETHAEIRMAASFGGEIAGMSTALEAIAAREAGLEVLGLSLITNHAAGTVDNQSLNHAEVLETGSANEERLACLMSTLINVIG